MNIMLVSVTERPEKSVSEKPSGPAGRDHAAISHRGADDQSHGMRHRYFVILDNAAGDFSDRQRQHDFCPLAGGSLDRRCVFHPDRRVRHLPGQ